MSETRTDALRVRGASVYYKVRGSGPVLFVLQGGAADADGSDAFADGLVDHYTVVTSDRRGFSRSPVDDPHAPIDLHTHSDDAHELLAALTTEPAFVLGVSIGALIGLDLVARSPEQVRLLVAHEPPGRLLLPEAERARFGRFQEAFEEDYRVEGAVVAMRKFMGVLGMDLKDREPGVLMPAPSPQRLKNLESFLAHDAPAVRLYEPDLAALRAARGRIAPAVGRTSVATAPDCLQHAAPARALAAELGLQVVEFPGGHGGCGSHPKAFAARLREVLAASGD